MNKLISLIVVAILSQFVSAQSYSPAAGELGSNAISKDSSVFVSWATGIEITRGYQDISSPADGLASFGTFSDALGPAEGTSTNVISLGDGGNAILTFATPITNGSGPDFAVFENGFTDNYLELAFVEVSSDGNHFVRFPAISETPTNNQLGPFDYNDCRFIHNLAGNFRQGFGTPFDLEDLVDSSGIDINAITHIRLIDVVGSIDPQYGSYDSQGNIINDLYPTNFASSGFDLDAIGVIHQQPLGLDILNLTYSIYPNPTTDIINISSNEPISVEIFNVQGEKLSSFIQNTSHVISLKNFNSQLIFVKLTDQNVHSVIKKVVIR